MGHKNSAIEQKYGIADEAASKRLVLLSMAVALSMLLLGGVMLWGVRADAWRQAELASDNLALALERDIARNIAIFDLSLQGAVEALGQLGIDRVSPEIRQAAVFDRAASAEYLGSMVVLDTAGKIVADSTSLTPHDVNLADRDYFVVHRDSADAGMYVSQPFRSRVRGGDPSIAISRRISGPDGSFQGVVVGSLRLAYFQSLFGPLDLGPGGAVSLVRTDGRLVARVPARPGDDAIDFSKSYSRYANARSGQFVANSIVDGVPRLFTYRHVGQLPLLLSVAMATSAIDAGWREKAIFVGSIMTLLCGATIGLSLLFRKEMLRRLAAEARLALAAATDSLTGLANRRAFQEALAMEWRRALRGHMPVALLMIDADHFKRFNDRYGHPQGDRLLQQIAACIGKCLRRPADLAARYGGEEFVVLLPETDSTGAMGIAERIRASVAALEIMGKGPTGDQATVSIGVAVAYASADLSEAGLLHDADVALYAAKGAGRNRVVLSQANEPPDAFDLTKQSEGALPAER